MGLLEFAKKALSSKKESKKVTAKRRFKDFRGLDVDCTAKQLIDKYNENIVVKLDEVLTLAEIVATKGDLFSFELLDTDFETGAEILSKCHTASSLLRLHRRWLLQSGKYLPERRIEELVNRRLEESKAVTDIINLAINKVKESWIVDRLPDANGCYTTTMYYIKDKEFKEPCIHTAEYFGQGIWDCPSGYYVAAWKEEEPYVPPKGKGRLHGFRFNNS